MSSLSFTSTDSEHCDDVVTYKMVSSVRDVYAKRTSLDSDDAQEQAIASEEQIEVKSGGQSAADTSGDKGQPSDTQNPHRFSHLLSIMPAGVIVIDQRGVISLANQQASSLLDEPLEGELWRDVIARAFTPKADDGHEVSMRNGKRVKIDISPLIEEKGQLIVITDLTETRQMQQRIGHMQRLSSLGKMVASLAHQVRTPLSSALLYAENIKSIEASQAATPRFCEKLILRLKELESQVNDMLLFAKSDDNHIVKSVNANDVMNTSLQSVEAQFSEAAVTLSSYTETDELPLLCNITALSGAISNLLNNALQSVTSSGSSVKEVRLAVSKQTIKQAPYAVFSVIDSGSGIAKGQENRIFEPFYTTKSQGTGLGLAVVATVAKSHKGFLRCANREDTNGAIFSISIPLAPNLTAQDVTNAPQTHTYHTPQNQQSGISSESTPQKPLVHKHPKIFKGEQA